MKFKDFFENKKYLKVTYDCRFDSDSLFQQFQVKLTNVIDLSIWYQGINLSKGIELPEPTQSWVPHIPSLNKILLNLVPKEKVLNLQRLIARFGDYTIWIKRPIPLILFQHACNEI